MDSNEKPFATLVNSKVLREFESDKILLPGTDNYYSHPTFIIKNLSDYIHLVTSISSVNKGPYSDTVIFRGISDSQHDLVPGLSRLKNPDENTEFDLINDFLTRRPDAFNGLSDFDILAKMQHYGLPTRLLDFSLNPLVALYFACESKTTKNGRILCHSTYLQNDTSLVTNAICEATIRKKFDLNYRVEEYLCNEKLCLERYLVEVYLSEETIVVRPKYWNQRIANQAGVFMIFPNNLRDRYRKLLIMAKESNLSYAMYQFSFRNFDENIIRDILKKEPIDYYQEIYNKYNNYYLSNESFNKMFNSYKNNDPNIDFWEKNKKYFENRFLVDSSLKMLDSKIIQNSFCSIIVESKNKKKILQQLSHVGIGADYIYPELEYTAKEIKRKYE